MAGEIRNVRESLLWRTGTGVLPKGEIYGLCIRQTGESADAYLAVWQSAETPENKESRGGKHETVHDSAEI